MTERTEVLRQLLEDLWLYKESGNSRKSKRHIWSKSDTGLQNNSADHSILKKSQTDENVNT